MESQPIIFADPLAVSLCLYLDVRRSINHGVRFRLVMSFRCMDRRCVFAVNLVLYFWIVSFRRIFYSPQALCYLYPWLLKLHYFSYPQIHITLRFHIGFLPLF
jgi:hypothetical protein